MRRRKHTKLFAGMLAVLMGLTLPSISAKADTYEFRTGVGGKQYWYENGEKQGTVDDSLGIIGFGTNRGREIYDPATNAWYWLDSCYDGAKATGKEVWIPYIYQEYELVPYSDGPGRIANGISDEATIATLASYSNTDEAQMSDQIATAIRNRSGKWVRYDGNGKMLTGWVRIEGELARIYPQQTGNVYYYDKHTGAMATGDTMINGITYHFDETTGVCTNPNQTADSANTGSSNAYTDEYSSSNPLGLSAREKAAQAAILALKNEYPEGMRWTNDDRYTSRASNYYMGGGGCHAFALICSDAAFGSDPIYKITDHSRINRIRVGDILRINDDSHSVIVTGFEATGIIIAEGNYNSSIHWGRKLDWSILDTCDYMLTRYSEDWNGTHRPTEEQIATAVATQTANNPGDAVTLINQARAAQGLPGFSSTAVLNADAQQWLDYYANSGTYPYDTSANYVCGVYGPETAEALITYLQNQYTNAEDPSETNWSELMSTDYTEIGIAYQHTGTSVSDNKWFICLKH